MRNFLALSLAGLMWVAAGYLAIAATSSDVGKAVGVDPSADATLNNMPRTLVVGSNVGMGETVVTGATGDVQLLFPDQTKLLIGPNSSLLIEAYLLGPDQTVTQFAVDALGGTYRFITGSSAKRAYRIDTPTGMIGVRGTAFDFNVDAERGTQLVLFHGAVRMCNLSGKCVDLTQNCAVGSMADSGASILSPTPQAGTDMRSLFPYVQSDAALLPDFRIAGSGSCLTGPKASGMPSAPIHSIGPTHTLPPPRGTLKPSVRLYDPCANYAGLSRSERLALRRNHIVCPQERPNHPIYPGGDSSGSNGSLIGNPFQFPPPRTSR